MPTTAAPRRAIGSVKLPMPQKKSATRSPRTRIEQGDRAPNQHAIDRRVDLRELGRRVGEGRARTPAARRRDAVRRDGTAAAVSGPAGLQVELHAVDVGERAQPVFVRGRAARECAAPGIDRRRHGSSISPRLPATVADRQLDLRQPVAHRERRRRARAAPAAAPRSSAAGWRTTSCRRRSSTCVRGSRPARRLFSGRDERRAVHGAGTPRRPVDRRQNLRQPARARCATARLPVPAAWRRPARRHRSAAACTRRIRRNAGSAGHPRGASLTISSARAIS